MSAPPEVLIAEASRLLAINPKRAAMLAAAVLYRAPDDPRAQLILASSKRRLGDPAAAKRILAPLASRFPNAALTQYELGLSLAALTESAPAIAALDRATKLKPDLADGWKALGDLLFSQGLEQRAVVAFAQHERAVIMSPLLKPIGNLLIAGRLRDAELALLAHLARHENDAEALGLMARTVARQGRDAEAEALFDLYLSYEPEDEGAVFGRAEILFRRSKGAEALTAIRGLIAKQPEHPAYRNLLAATLALTGEYEEALHIYEGLLDQYGRQARLWLNYGHALRTVRQREKTIDAYRRAISQQPELGEAYWSLANLKNAAFTVQEEAAMREHARTAPTPDDRLHFLYALGKALEDQADYKGSFDHYAEGAALRRTLSPYDADQHRQRLAAIRAVATPAFFAERAEGGFESDEPIFVLGLPRSGSTLVEQILASHSAVEGTMELPDIGLIAAEIATAPSARSYHHALTELNREQRLRLGRRYIDQTRVHRKTGRRYFVDKMPNNFEHIPLIQLLLPKARIIDVRRHPMGACFSAFKQHFARGQDFSYDLADLGRYYHDYAELMAHFDAVLPGRVHRMLYEDLIGNMEQEVRKLLAYCGLPFEEGCLRFYENARAVRTVSSEQVRQPLYSHGLDHWRHYEPWLLPLSRALGRWRNDWRG